MLIKNYFMLSERARTHIHTHTCDGETHTNICPSCHRHTLRMNTLYNTHTFQTDRITFIICHRHKSSSSLFQCGDLWLVFSSVGIVVWSLRLSGSLDPSNMELLVTCEIVPSASSLLVEQRLHTLDCLLFLP